MLPLYLRLRRLVRHRRFVLVLVIVLALILIEGGRLVWAQATIN